MFHIAVSVNRRFHVRVGFCVTSAVTNKRLTPVTCGRACSCLVTWPSWVAANDCRAAEKRSITSSARARAETLQALADASSARHADGAQTR